MVDSLAFKEPNRDNLHNSDSVDLDRVNPDSSLNNAVSVDLKPISVLPADVVKSLLEGLNNRWLPPASVNPMNNKPKPDLKVSNPFLNDVLFKLLKKAFPKPVSKPKYMRKSLLDKWAGYSQKELLIILDKKHKNLNYLISKEKKAFKTASVIQSKVSDFSGSLCSNMSLSNSQKCCSFDIQGADSSECDSINFFDDNCVFASDFKKNIYKGFLDHDVDSILGYANSYALDCADKIVLLKSDSNKDGSKADLKYKGIPWVTRFDSVYAEKIRMQLEHLFNYRGVLTKMTLSVYDFQDPAISDGLLKDNISKLFAFIRKITGNPNLHYIASEEVKDNKDKFHVHVHGVIFGGLGFQGAAWFSPKILDAIKNKWFYLTGGLGRYVWLEGVDCSDGNSKGVLKHALKYPLKNSAYAGSDVASGNDFIINLTNAFLFCVGGRSFTTSLNLNSDCDPLGLLQVDNRVWVKCGCGYAWFLLQFIKESDFFNADEIKARYKNIHFKSEIDEVSGSGLGCAVCVSA